MTKTASERRPLRFGSMDDLLADIDALDHRGEVQATGQWTAAQNVEHVCRFIDGSVEGFNTTAPLPMRIIGRLIRKRAMSNPLKPGFKVPANMNAFKPPADFAWSDAVAHLRSSIARAKQDRMTKPSPMFGDLTHDEWVQLHCRHAELHFSFLR